MEMGDAIVVNVFVIMVTLENSVNGVSCVLVKVCDCELYARFLMVKMCEVA